VRREKRFRVSFSPCNSQYEVPMGKIVINIDYCKGCELCTTACAKKLLKIGTQFNKNGYYAVEYCGEDGDCTGCALCAEMCPDIAIEVWK
jgi:2-oxoglutarate ferredoxin oxidoreductase subunit delta